MWQRHRRGNHDDMLCVGFRRVLADAHFESVAFDLQLGEIVLTNKVENLLDIVEIHAGCRTVEIITRSRGASVSSSDPPDVTTTSSSNLTPPRPSTYAPGSIVHTIPAS